MTGNIHSRVAVRPAFTWRRCRAEVDVAESFKMSPYCMGPPLVDLLPRARSVTLQADGLLPYDFDQMHSNSLKELIVEFDSVELARCLEDAVRTRVMGRFPKLRRLALTCPSERMAPLRLDI